MPRVIVLKLGGSVLRSEADYPAAVHEIVRWRREGYAVVAVVSAVSGATDAWLRRAGEISPDADPHAVAAFVVNGEQQSASWLGLYLDRAGVPSRVLSPSALRLIAEGPAGSASPVGIDRERLQGALAAGDVAVVPGYFAEDDSGRIVLFGRGGSDLSALFLAAELGARCRLIKDVDGLYDRDPREREARRYVQASFEDALRTDGSILQHEAVRFAKERALRFEVGELGASDPTVVGSVAGERLERVAVRPRPKRVALLGAGTVGGGVWQRLVAHPESFDVRAVAVRSLPRALTAGVPIELLRRDPIEAASSGVDIVIEAMGGVSEARRACEAALRSGAHVVTANKTLLATFGEELERRAKVEGRCLLGSAAVGGGVPILERLALEDPGEVVRVRGVLNGTSNFVLERCAAGASLSEASHEAERNGLAESDPYRDFAGLDASAKLTLIARQLGWRLKGAPKVQETIDEDAARRASEARRAGRSLRQVATLEHAGLRAAIRLEELESEDPLADLPGCGNAIAIERTDGTSLVLRGRGAGRWPTTEAILSDLFELVRKEANVPVVV
ncbi:MAG: aspartate kinase [Planctomycetota bacterium]